MAGALLIGDRYEVRSVLGRGGMGVVYRAYDTLMRREVAVKTLRDIPSGVFIDLFYRECSVLAGMVHPNVVEVFDMGEFEEDGVAKPFFVMPLLPGQTLHDLLYPAAVPLSALRAVDIISQCCRGLQAAHDRGLLHRDIKPRNIFVMRDDAVKVIDFGVAHLMGNNSTGVRGTPQYMSPEQITFKALTNRSDVFSIASVAYEAVTATHPFVRGRGANNSDADIAVAITSYNPPPATELNPGVSRAVSQVIAKGMMKEPRARFESAAAFADALQRALRNEGDTVRSMDGLRTRLERARRSFEKSDLQFAAEIVNELEAEGHSDPAIVQLRHDIDAALQRDRTERLMVIAQQYLESEEYTLALKKVQEVLEIVPTHPDAVALNARIETVLTQHKVAELLAAAKEHLEKSSFTNARQAAQDVLKIRPNDPRARQILGQVDAKQKELLRSRQEQERLFQSAQADWLQGKIEAAIASLESLAELTRRSDDNRERVAEYKEFYRRVRQERDDLTAAIERASRLLQDGDPAAAQLLCDRYLAKYPHYPSLHEVVRDIARFRQEEEIRYQTNVAERLAAQPLIDQRLNILEDALKVYPTNAFCLEETQNLHKLQQRVDTLANDARARERNSQFQEAIELWRSLRQLYPAFPGIEQKIESNTSSLQRQRAEASAAFVTQISAALAAENYAAADKLFAAADVQVPGDQQIADLKSKRSLEAQRSVDANRLIDDALRLVSLGKTAAASDALGKAVEISRGLPVTSERLATAALKQADKIVRRDWRSAYAVLENVFGSLDATRIPQPLREEILKHQREENIRGALDEIARHRQQHRLADALTHAQRAAIDYAGDARIQNALKAVEAEIAELHRREQRQSCLAALAQLKKDFERSSSAPDLGAIQAQAKSLAAGLLPDTEIEQASREIIVQSSHYQQAHAALLRGEYETCQSLCDEELKRNPQHQPFLALKQDASARERQQATEYLADTERKLGAEPLLDARAGILAEAAQRYPNEPFFREQLNVVRDKQKSVEELADRARKLQRSGSIPEAYDEWKKLAAFYPYYPGVADAVTACARMLQERQEQQRRNLVASIQAEFSKHEYQKAIELAGGALQEFPEDADLLSLEKASTERRDIVWAAERMLAQARAEFSEGNLSLGLQTVQDALKAAKTEPQIATAAAKLLLERANDALLLDLALAEAMIAEAQTADPEQPVSQQLTASLNEARRQHAFEDCATSVKSLESSGDLDEALATIRRFLTTFPRDKQGEAVEARLRSSIDERERQAEKARTLAQLKTIEQQATQPNGHEALVHLLSRLNKLVADNSRSRTQRGGY